MPRASAKPLPPLRLIVLITIVACVALQPPAPAALKTYVHDSPPAADLLSHALDRLDRDEPEEAVKLVQQVIDEHGARLLELEKGRYAEARRVASLTLAERPRLLAAYEELYNAPALQMLAEAGNDAAKLTAVTDRYAMTTAGLTAGMRLAGLHLEAGRGEASSVMLVRLADHPALESDRELWLELSATAALLSGDRAGYERFSAELAARPDATRAADRVAAMAGVLDRPAALRPLSPLGLLPPAAPPDTVARPLWTQPISGAERWLSQFRRAGRSQLDDQANQGHLLNTMMAVYGGRLFINSGASVHAVEPASGRELWTHNADAALTSADAQAQALGGLMPRDMDLSGIAADEGHVLAVAGFNAMLAASFAYYGSIGSSQLVCLNPATGDVMWTRAPLDVDADLDGAAWYGQPVLWQGRAYCTIRRRARFTFQDTFLICLDADTGKLLWRRHLGSTALSERRTSPGLSHMTLHAGWVYLDSGLGTVAKIAAADGMVQWLLTHEMREDAGLRNGSRPWATSGPVVTRAGVVVFDDWENVIRLYAQADGKVVRTINANEWDGPLYICAIGEDVLAVGTTCGRYSGEDLSNLWRHKTGASIRGRAAVTESLLYLPADNRVLLVDPRAKLADADRREVGAREIELPATLLALDGQLIAAQRHRVSAFTSWQVAMTRLREQIEQSPLDHHPLLALAWLAYGHDRPDALIDSLDRAIALIRAAPDSQRLAADLFEQMRSMAVDDTRPDFGVREKLFERMAAVAASPDQEVVYRLVYGAHLESVNRLGAAIEQYQALLAEPVYRQRLYRHSTGSRQAGLEAHQRLRAIVEQHGREVYAPFEEVAARRLAELADQNDPAPLEDLAMAYPMAATAPEALSLAAERAAAQGRAPHAVALLHRAAQLASDPIRRAAIVGREAELLQSLGEPNRAAHAIRKLLLAHPDARPIRAGQPVDTAPWLAELDAATRRGSSLARLNLPLTGSGTSVRATAMGDPIDAGEGRSWLLLATDNAIECRRAADLTLVWTHAVPTADARLIAANAKRTYLYFPNDKRLLVLDTATGQARWEDSRVAARIEAIPVPNAVRDPNDPRWVMERNAGNRVIIRGEVMIVNGRVIQRGDAEPVREPADPGPLLAADDDSVAIADARGRIIVLSGDRGDVRWQIASPLRRADHLAILGEHLVIAGHEDDDSPLLCVYEASSGTLLHRIRKPKLNPFNWIGMTGNGRLVFVGDTQIEMFDLVRGQTTWLCEPGSRLRPKGATRLGFDTLITATREGEPQIDHCDLILVNLENGQLVGRRPIRAIIEGGVGVRSDLGNWIVFGQDQLLALDAEGRERWRGVVTGGVRVIDALVAEDHVAALAVSLNPQAAAARELFIFDRATGLLRSRSAFTGAALNTLNAADGKLILAGDKLTVLLDGAAQ